MLIQCGSTRKTSHLKLIIGVLWDLTQRKRRVLQCSQDLNRCWIWDTGEEEHARLRFHEPIYCITVADAHAPNAKKLALHLLTETVDKGTASRTSRSPGCSPFVASWPRSLTACQMRRTPRQHVNNQKPKKRQWANYTGKRPQTVWGGRKSRKSMYQVQATSSNSSNGTVTGQVTHYRTSRNLFWHKKHRYVCSSRPHTRTSYQNLIPPHVREFQEIAKGPSTQRVLEDVQELAMSIPEELSCKHKCRASSKS